MSESRTETISALTLAPMIARLFWVYVPVGSLRKNNPIRRRFL